jgi:hypothetical protein
MLSLTSFVFDSMSFLVTPSTETPSGSRDELVLHLPFEFEVASRSMQPGFYKVEQITAFSTDKKLLLIRSLDGTFYQTMSTKVPQTQESASPSKLVFRFSSGRPVLHQVWFRETRQLLEITEPGSEEIETRNAERGSN